MDEFLQLYRGIGTAVLLVMFIGLCIWAYSRNRNEAFSEAELYPFDDETAAEIKAKREDSTNE